MAWFLSIILAGLVCGVVFLIGQARGREWGGDSPRGRMGAVSILAIMIFVGWVGGHTAYNTIKRIEAGHVAIVYQFGEIVGSRGEGLQYIAPWQEIRTESAGVQEHTFADVSGYSAEVLEVTASVTVEYRVDREGILQLYRLVGPDWFDILTEPRITQFFRAETVKYEADEVVAKGEEIRSRIHEALTADLPSYGITVEGVRISDWVVGDK